MRVVLFAVVLAGCAATQPAVRTPVACAGEGPVVMPAWAGAEPTAGEPEARVLADLGRSRETRRIVPEPERDPVDDVLAAHGGRRRLGAISLREAPVTDTLRMFAELGGFNLVFADEVSDRRITLDLRHVTLGAAFRAVLSAAHLGADVVGGPGERPGEHGVVEVGPRPARLSQRGP